jgi:hypothetical protein
MRSTEQKVESIREEHAAGRAGVRELAAKHGLGRATIQDILAKRTWRRVRTPNYAVRDGVARFELSRGLVGLVDEADLPRLEPDGVEFAWIGRWRAHVDDTGRYTHYMTAAAQLPDGSRAVAMAHRLIMGLRRGDPLEVDHIHHDGLDNRRSELRVVSGAGNQHNRRGKKPRRLGETPTSRHPGVHWNRAASNWRVRIGLDRRRIHLGDYDSELDAAAAYMRAKAVRDAGGGQKEIKATAVGQRRPNEKRQPSKVAKRRAESIRGEYAGGGISVRGLATKHGLGKSTVHSILAGRTCAALEPDRRHRS